MNTECAAFIYLACILDLVGCRRFVSSTLKLKPNIWRVMLNSTKHNRKRLPCQRLSLVSVSNTKTASTTFLSKSSSRHLSRRSWPCITRPMEARQSLAHEVNRFGQNTLNVWHESILTVASIHFASNAACCCALLVRKSRNLHLQRISH